MVNLILLHIELKMKSSSPQDKHQQYITVAPLLFSLLLCQEESSITHPASNPTILISVNNSCRQHSLHHHIIRNTIYLFKGRVLFTLELHDYAHSCRDTQGESHSMRQSSLCYILVNNHLLK
jgi:hypothetical protein